MEVDNEYLSELKFLVKTNPHGYTKLLKNSKRYLLDWIETKTPLLKDPFYSVSTKVYWVLNGLTNFPRCKYKKCGKMFGQMTNVKASFGYFSYCCNRHAQLDDETLNKVKATKIKNHGDPYFTNREKSKETYLRHRKNDPNFVLNIQEKMKSTKTERYGDPNFCNLEKRKATNLAKYGNEMFLQSEIGRKKKKETCLRKYGTEYYQQTEEFKNKTQETSFRKYGTKYFTQSEEFKKLWLDPDFVQSAIEKQIETKKKNHSFKISKKEETCFALLKETFPIVICQYRSESYPFNCDFYIPEKDLYIEFNGTWTHGGHAFDPNNEEDMKLVEMWKSKNTKFYNNAIKNWTQRDVKKRETAKKNNLNFIEFWNLDEVKTWINTQEKTNRK